MARIAVIVIMHLHCLNMQCLDRCADGPVMVVYPEGVWYTLVDQEDVEEIIQSHLIAGQPVKRLELS